MGVIFPALLPCPAASGGDIFHQKWGSAFAPTPFPLPVGFFPVAYGRQRYICSDFQEIRYPLLNFHKRYQSK